MTASTTTPRTSTEELGNVRLTLRDDLSFSLQSHGGQTCYVLEDEAHGSFFRIGVAEYMFVSLLDGRTTVEQAVARTAVSMGADALSEQSAAAVCRWLIDNQLAQTDQSVSAARLNETHTARAAGRWKQSLNPMVVVLKLGNPEPWLEALLPLTRWMMGPIGWLVWGFVCLLGLMQVLVHSRELWQNSVQVVSPHNWLCLVLSWLGLKLIHETAHGVSCLSRGGRVREWGVNTVLFVPLPFVDVTSAWRFPSKWSRMQVAAAGMSAELFVAALAVQVWCRSEVGVVRQVCESVMLTGGVLSILFNANPLMRFDGYYILADWLELPNLAQHAQHDLNRLGKRWLFGVKTSAPAQSFRSAAIIRLYGILASLWKVTVTGSLILAAEAMFHGAGLVLAVSAAILWILWPLSRFVTYALVGDPVERPQRVRFAIIAMTLVVAGAGTWNRLQWSEHLVLPAVVDYTPAVTVRSPVGGFVSRIAVRSGESVQEGDVLIELDNPEIAYDEVELTTAIAKSELRSQSFQNAEEIAARQIEDENRVALQKRLREKRRQQTLLILRAPASGRVIADDLPSLAGRFVAPGESLLLIGDERTKQLQTLVTAANVADLQDRVGSDVDVTFWGDGSQRHRGRLTRIEPRATSALRHPALSATVGGPLAVRSRPRDEGVAASESDAAWELIEPRFVAHVELPHELRQQLGAGQLGHVRLTTTRRSLGEVVSSRIADWIDTHRPRR